jgi:hypothetical protein
MIKTIKTMRKMLMMAVAAALMCGCEKELKVNNADPVDDATEAVVNGPTKKFTFTVKGDFGSPTFRDGDQGEASVNGTGSAAPRRATTYLTDEGNQMTDLWVFDFVGESCVQSIHQTTSDATWGKPQMSLALGTHHIYFVASRGVSPVVNATDKTIVWSSVRDTYWKDYEVTVVNTSNGNRAVTLERVVAKLKLTVNDEIPVGAATLVCTPDTWYYGMNYRTGVPVTATNDQAISINIPANYVGTTGQLVASFFTVSVADEWTTDASVAIKDGNRTTLGSAVIANAPMKRNRSTEYSGNLFSGSSNMSVSIDGDWSSPYIGTW